MNCEKQPAGCVIYKIIFFQYRQQLNIVAQSKFRSPTNNSTVKVREKDNKYKFELNTISRITILPDYELEILDFSSEMF